MNSEEAVDTIPLTKSFGWTSADSFRQHDVQEFSRILMDNVEIKMKNSTVDGVIKGICMYVCTYAYTSDIERSPAEL